VVKLERTFEVARVLVKEFSFLFSSGEASSGLLVKMKAVVVLWILFSVVHGSLLLKDEGRMNGDWSSHQLSNATDGVADGVNAAVDVANRYTKVWAAVAIPLGLFFCLFGQRFMKPALFVAGSSVGGFFIFAGVFAISKDSSAGVWVPIVASILGGLLCGILAVVLLPLGIFLMGAALGVAIGIALRPLADSIAPDNPQTAFYLMCLILALIFGILTLCLQKAMIILATAFGGSLGVIYGIAYLAGAVKSLSDWSSSAASGSVTAWSCFGGWLALGLIGAIIQFVFTSRRKE